MTTILLIACKEEKIQPATSTVAVGLPPSSASPKNTLRNEPFTNGPSRIPRSIPPNYSEVFSYIKEESLFDSTFEKGREVYRFLWLRSFDPLVMVRVEKNESTYSLNLKTREKTSIGEMLVEKKVTLTEKDWLSFKDLLVKSNYWQMSVEGSAEGFDGSHWILEAKTPDKYHVVDRWSAPSTGSKEFTDTCLFLLKLTGQTFKHIY